MASYTLPQHVVTRRFDGREEVLLHRSVAVFGGDRIEIRSAKSTLVLPVLGLLAASGLSWLLISWTAMPFWAMVSILLVLLVLVPLSAMALVNAIVGAEVVVDAAKQSATWQQGYLGLGVGTKELVPFWKIDRIEIVIEGEEPDRWHEHADDLRQFQLILVKESGKRLTLANVPVPADRQEDGMDRALAVGQAIASVTGSRLVIPEGWRMVTIDVESGQIIDESALEEPRPRKRSRRGKRGRRT